MKPARKRSRSLPLIVFWTFFAANCPFLAQGSEFSLTDAIMGTTYLVKVVVPKNKAFSKADLKKDIHREFAKVDTAMSTYKKNSLVSRFNRSPKNIWFALNPSTHDVIAKAMEIHKLSQGALDIAIGPLIKLWGFGADARPMVVPKTGELNQMRALVGVKHLELNLKPLAVRKKVTALTIDLSSLAKGLAVDKVAELLEKKKYLNYMVELGGEVRVGGVKANGEKWSIGLENPTPGRRNVHKVLKLSNTSLATSGDYRNYFESEGVRYSHTIDPSTGRPITHKLASVTVIHPSCMDADAWATALMVAGPIKGLELAKKHGLAAYFIVRKADGFSVSYANFDKYRSSQ